LATHVKPWRDSKNEERLDAEDGLLTSFLPNSMSDSIGRITVPAVINSGQTFALSTYRTASASPSGAFACLEFLAGARFVFGCGTSGADAFSDSVVLFISFLLDRAAVVIIHHSGPEKQQVISSTISLLDRVSPTSATRAIGGAGPFL
jgi:hypothetical protein